MASKRETSSEFLILVSQNGQSKKRRKEGKAEGRKERRNDERKEEKTGRREDKGK